MPGPIDFFMRKLMVVFQLLNFIFLIYSELQIIIWGKRIGEVDKNFTQSIKELSLAIEV